MGSRRVGQKLELSLPPRQVLDLIKEEVGRFITVGGLVQCYELETGELVWNERLFGAGAQNGSWSSLLLSEENLYLLNKAGEMSIC